MTENREIKKNTHTTEELTIFNEYLRAKLAEMDGSSGYPYSTKTWRESDYLDLDSVDWTELEKKEFMDELKKKKTSKKN